MACADASQSQQHTPAPDAQPAILSDCYPLTAPLAIALAAPLSLAPDFAFGALAEELTAQRIAGLPPRLARKFETGPPRWGPAAVRRDEDGDIIMDDGNAPPTEYAPTTKRPRTTSERLDADSPFPPRIARKVRAHRAALYMTATPAMSEAPIEIEYHSSSTSPGIVGASAIEEHTTATPAPLPAAIVLDDGHCVKRAREAVVAPSDRVLRARKGIARPATRRLGRQEGTEGRHTMRGDAARLRVVRFNAPVSGKGQVYISDAGQESAVFGEERRDFRIICASPV